MNKKIYNKTVGVLCFVMLFNLMFMNISMVSVGAEGVKESFEFASWPSSWQDVKDKKSPEIRSDKAHSDTKSIKIMGNQVKRYPQSLSKKRVSIWIYDDKSIAKYSGVLKLTSGTSGVIIGAYCNASPDKYVFRVGDLKNPWLPSTIVRSTGWHKLTIDCTSGTQTDVYLDGKKVTSTKDMTSFDGIEIGDYWGGSTGASYFDDMEISDQADTATFSTNQQEQKPVEQPAQQNTQQNTQQNQVQNINSEGFEFATWPTEWKNIADKVSPQLSTEKAHGGNKSVKLGMTQAKRYPQSLSKKRVSVWIYDDKSIDKYNGVLKLTSGTSGVIIGAYCNASLDKYVFRVGDLKNPWVPSTIVRSTGWHKLTIDFTSGTQTDVYLDGKKVTSTKDMTSFDGIEIGDYWGGTTGVAYVDDMEISDQPDTQSASTSASQNTVQQKQMVYSDVTGDLNDVVKVLVGLNLFEGYKDGTFKPEDSITRAVFASVIVKALGLESVGMEKKDTMYTDVPKDHWASGYISVASDLGLIKGVGDGTFNLDAPITYEQAVKVIVSALGYELIAEDKGGYPVGYQFVANEKGINKGVAVSNGEALKRGMAARLIYNALEVDLMEKTGFGNQLTYNIVKDKTLLSEKLKIKTIKGIIRGVGKKTTSPYLKLNDDNILVENTMCKIKQNSDFDSYVGYYTKVYAYDNKDTGDLECLFAIIDKGKNETVTIKADDIEAISDSTKYIYWKNKDKDNDTSEAELSQAVSIIYNNRPIDSAVATNYYRPLSGTVKLIDNNGDSIYDVLIINSYYNVVINSVDKSDKKVFDKYTGLAPNIALDLDDDSDKYIKITKDSKGVTFDDIAEGDVLTIVESLGTSNKSVEVIINTAFVTGKVTETLESNKKLVIAGKEYEYAKNYWDYATKVLAKIGDEGMFYLDAEGKIAHQTISSGYQYGYLIDCKDVKGISDAIQMKMMLDDGKIVIYNSKDKIELINTSGTKTNGKAKDSLPSLTPFSHNLDNNHLSNGLIQYQLDKDGKVNKIRLAKTVANIKVVDEDAFVKTVIASNCLYKDNAATLVTTDKYIATVIIDSNTKIFVLKNKVNTFTLDEDNSGILMKLTNDNIVTFYAYDQNEIGTVKAIVVLPTSPRVSTAKSEEDSLLVVDHITQVVKDGDIKYQLYGLSKGKKVVCNYDESSSKIKSYNFVKGNVFDPKFNMKGDLVDKDTYPSSDPNKLFGRNVSFVSPDYVLKGSVASKKDKIIMINYTTNATTNTTETYDERYNLGLGNPYIYVFDRQNDKVSVGTIDDIIEGREVIARCNDWRIEDIIVYK